MTNANAFSPDTLIFGEILWDEYAPDQRTLGGAPLNVAWHLLRLGLRPAIVSRVGKDADGEEALRVIRESGLWDGAIQRDNLLPTGKARVLEVGRDERGFEITQPCAYDKITFDEVPEALQQFSAGQAPRFLYHGTLALRDSDSADCLRSLLNALPEQTEIFTDLNLREPHYTGSTVEVALLRATMAKLSRVEMDYVCRLAGIPQEPIRDALADLCERFDLKKIVVTDGAKTVHGLEAGPGTQYEVTPPRLTREQIEQGDTVGAGDAFTASLIAGEMKGKHWIRLLEEAAKYAAETCQYTGAIPETAPETP
jgi:fructokinase